MPLCVVKHEFVISFISIPGSVTLGVYATTFLLHRILKSKH